MQAERKIGLDSHLVNMHETSSEALDQIAQCDVLVPHTHLPVEIRRRRTKPLRMVFIGHGTPEYVFNSSIEAGRHGYGHGDGFMLWQYWMQHCDAIATFWPRHQAIMRSMCDKNTKVHLIPLGLDLEFWQGGTSKGKFSGRPSMLTCENSHFMKWAYDIFIAWPWVYEQVLDACLHVSYLPTDQHRWYFPLINRNGASYGAHVSPSVFGHEELRNVLKSVDFYCNPVRYGDHNRMGLEASAAGAKLISYKGNPYADFWLTEGDQRTIAAELVAIFKGEVEARADKLPVADAVDMAQAMKVIYEDVTT